eukprot:363662-Chlamydomonas_euryale.AAC.7
MGLHTTSAAPAPRRPRQALSLLSYIGPAGIFSSQCAPTPTSHLHHTRPPTHPPGCSPDSDTTGATSTPQHALPPPHTLPRRPTAHALPHAGQLRIRCQTPKPMRGSAQAPGAGGSCRRSAGAGRAA